MSVTRKPSYDLASVWQRVTWFPILHDTFSRMWPVLALGLTGAWGILARWRRAPDAERLLFLWVAVGTLELLVHDVGNERRFVFLIPALVALASLVLARGSLLPRRSGARAAPDGRPARAGDPVHRLRRSADRSRGCRFSPRCRRTCCGMRSGWPRRPASCSDSRSWPRGRGSPPPGRGACGARPSRRRWWPCSRPGTWPSSATGRLHRTYENYEASLALGRALPPGTLVQGKLANGLALDNAIRPIFIGHEFGNYDDRKQRWDVRYILTYTDPGIGYEGGPDRGRAGRVSGPADHHDLRRRGNAFRPRQARPDRESVRAIDERAIKAHADLRFRSEYDYALFEYYRSAKVIAFLERAGVAVRGRVLDAGCGGGGMPLSLAEEAGAGRRHRSDRSVRPGGRPARPRARAARTCTSRSPTAWRCRSRRERSTWCCRTPSSSTSPTRRSICASARRVLAPGGRMYLSTAPYLSFAGAHLPRLKMPRAAAPDVRPPDRVRHVRVPGAPRAVDAEGAGARELVHPAGAQSGEIKHDDLLEKVTVVAAAARRSPRPGCGSSARSCTSRRPCAGCRRRRHGGCSRTAWSRRTCSSATWNTCWPARVLESSECRWRTSTATDQTIGASSKRSTAACSAPTRPRRTVCAGTGSTAATRTIPAASPRSGSRAKGTAIVGQYATMPVQLSVQGPRGRRLLGHGRDGRARSDSARASAKCSSAPGIATSARRSASACRTRPTGCSRSCSWPDVGPVPCLVKPLTRRALRRPRWPVADQPPRLRAHAAVVRLVARTRPLSAEVRRHPAVRRELHASCGSSSSRSSTSPSGATRRT